MLSRYPKAQRLSPYQRDPSDTARALLLPVLVGQATSQNKFNQGPVVSLSQKPPGDTKLYNVSRKRIIVRNSTSLIRLMPKFSKPE